MKIAITGANGFVGNNLSDYLTHKGLEILRVQRKRTGNSIFIPKCDKTTNWSKALKDVETVIHCAAIVHQEKNKPFESYYKVNVQGTESLINQAVKSGVKNIIFISTIKVNGEESSLLNPFKDDSNDNPNDYYAISKLLAETILKSISIKEGINYVIIRPGLIYGPGVSANFYNLIKLIDSGIPLPFGDIRNKRSLLFIDNLGEFIFQIIDKNSFNNQIFLLSDSKPISLKKLVNLIYFYLNKRNKNFYFPVKLLNLIFSLLGKKNISSRLFGSLVIDSSQAYKNLHLEQFFSSDYGIKKTVEWYLNQK